MERSDSVSPFSVVPPIIANENDRHFLINLNSYIDSELAKSQSSQLSATQRYTVFKAAFDQIIEYVSAYKPILTAIKSEYEDTIDALQRGQREAFFLSGKVKAMSSEHSTIHNYQKRADDLDTKISVIQADNERLKEEIEKTKKSKAMRDELRLKLDNSPQYEAHDTADNEVRHIPGLSMKDSTNMEVLQKELVNVEAQLKEISLARKTRYIPKSTKVRLKNQLEGKVVVRDRLSEETEAMKQRRQKLKIAVEAAHAWMKTQPPVNTIGQAVCAALSRANKYGGYGGDDGGQGASPSLMFEEDDPTREKEAEVMLEYIEKFNELMEDKMYSQAAVHAANSPKSILRTPETLNRFKALPDQLFLLEYCEALMSTVPAYKINPNASMSHESVLCALNQNRLDLLAHWIAQDRLTLTEALGDEIFGWGKTHHQQSAVALALSQQVYTRLSLHRAAAGCLVRQGRVCQAVEYASQHDALSQQDYRKLLETVPSIKLGLLLVRKSILPLGEVYNTLEAAGLDAAQLPQSIYNQNNRDSVNSSKALRDAVFSDKGTPYEDWEKMAGSLQGAGHQGAAIEVMAAGTVVNTILSAAKRLQENDLG